MPYGYGSANRGPSGPGPGGQGARGQATQNPGRAPAPTYQNVHQTGAVTQTPGRPPTVTTGGPPSILNPPTTPVTTGGPPSILNPPPVIPKGRTTTGGIPGNSLINFLTGRHFGVRGNREKLLKAYQRGLITERQYKLMSGYDASEEIIGLGGSNLMPTKLPANLAASGIYNLVKTAIAPEDFIGKIGPVESTILNTMGSTGYGFDKNQYSGILELSPESLETNPYGSNYSSKIAQTIGAPAYDFADGGIADLYRHGGFSG